MPWAGYPWDHKKVAHEVIRTYISAAREYHPIRVAASRWHLATDVHTTRDFKVYSILFSLSAKLIGGICCALPGACTPSNQNKKYTSPTPHFLRSTQQSVFVHEPSSPHSASGFRAFLPFVHECGLSPQSVPAAIVVVGGWPRVRVRVTFSSEVDRRGRNNIGLP